jgi:hypothetical protein
MFNKICIKDECLIKVSFLKYSGLLDYLVYMFSSGVYRLEVCCVLLKYLLPLLIIIVLFLIHYFKYNVFHLFSIEITDCIS